MPSATLPPTLTACIPPLTGSLYPSSRRYGMKRTLDMMMEVEAANEAKPPSPMPRCRAMPRSCPSGARKPRLVERIASGGSARLPRNPASATAPVMPNAAP